MINIDTFIEIGSQHQMCEDYIISGHNHIILADGCSSSDHSEMGARFLCYMAREFLKGHGVYPHDSHFRTAMPEWIIYNAENLVRQLGLSQTSLDATLIVSYIYQDRIYIHMYGDGCIVLHTGDDEFTVFEVDYKAGPKSMPYYLRYMLDMKGKKSYHDAKVAKTLKTFRIMKEEVGEMKTEEMAYDHACEFSFPVSDYRSISITSDGLSTFLKAKADPDGNKIMTASDMVPFIFDFKTSAGVFLQRQMNICKRQMKKVDMPFEHFDDLSIGTYLIEDQSNDESDSI